MNITDVILSKQALKDLRKVPTYIALKLQAWIDTVSYEGIRETRKLSGYHDEPLKGKRQGQRSIRLSKHYRAIYRIDELGVLHFIEVLEINKHEY